MNKENGASNGPTILSTEYLNENSILVVSKSPSDEYNTVSVRYLEDEETKEDRIAFMKEDISIEYNERMVAVFKKPAQRFRKPKLVAVYDATRHEFGSEEMLRLDYYSLSYEGINVRQLNKRSK